MSAAPESAPDTGTALYLSAIARLSAGLREVRHACERGDAPHAIAPVAVGALADVDKLQLPQPEPAVTVEALAAALDGREFLVTRVHSAPGDQHWLATPARPRALAVQLLSAIDTRLTDDAQPEPQHAPAGLYLTEHGVLALRPALSATVVVAAGGAIDDDRKALMLAAFAQDGLRAVFVENATAIGELPPDPALRADLGAMAARWADQAAAHNRDAGKASRSVVETAVLSAKARVYDANATEVREAIEAGS